MHRSWFDGRRPRHRPISLAAVAAVAAIGVGSTAGPAAAASGRTCGTVAGETSAATWAHVAVEDVRGISCAGARKVVRQCLARDRVKGWTRAAEHAAPGLRDGRRRLTVDPIGGDLPTCVEHDRTGGRRTGVGADGPDDDGGRDGIRLGAVTYRTAGPNEGPVQMPPTARTKWTWTSPIASVKSGEIDVSSVRLHGAARTTDMNARSVWFQYGTTRDLGQSTERLPPKVLADDAPWPYSQEIRGLRAKTRYYWRAMASFGSDGDPKTLTGATGSFVTEGYRSMGGANPCQQLEFGTNAGGTTQVTEALAVVCSPKYEFVNDKQIVASVGYSGRLSCPREYPHNLNAGNYTVTIPKIDYDVSFDNLVNYWRSNDSARFTRFPGYQKNYEGAEQGPLLGWHEWNVDQWGYLFSTSRTHVQMWINCTDNWKAFSPEQLARGEGDDAPSRAAPGAPRDFRFAQAADGDWNGSWAAPQGGVPGGLAGYQLSVDSMEDSSRMSAQVLTDTDLRGSLTAAHVKALAAIFGTKRLYAHVWAFSSEGVRSATSATIPITAP